MVTILTTLEMLFSWTQSELSVLNNSFLPMCPSDFRNWISFANRKILQYYLNSFFIVLTTLITPNEAFLESSLSIFIFSPCLNFDLILTLVGCFISDF